MSKAARSAWLEVKAENASKVSHAAQEEERNEIIEMTDDDESEIQMTDEENDNSFHSDNNK